MTYQSIDGADGARRARRGLAVALALAGGALAEPASTFNTGFAQAFSLTFLSELGDKTFFIAGLLAVKFTRVVSFVGSLGALAVMTVLSVLIGQVFHSVPASISNGIPLDDWAAAGLFLYFGVQTLRDAYALPEGAENDEELEAKEEVDEIGAGDDDGVGWANLGKTFSLVFAAEFGDKSFISTIGLGAAQNPFGVTAGAILAHGSATGLAVVGGALLSRYISEKTIGYVGGSLFLVFAGSTLLSIFTR